MSTGMRSNQTFRHYKGGIYRLLFPAKLIRIRHITNIISYLDVGSVLHVDDKRELRLAVDEVYGMVLLEANEESESTDGSLDTSHVVYVSLTYATIWGRRTDEFYETIMCGHEQPRFAPIMLDDQGKK